MQLVLLTRAQWRAAAKVPLAVHGARKLLEPKWAEQRQQVAASVKGFEQTTTIKAGELEKLAAEQAATTKRTLSEMHGRLSETEKVAERIRHELEDGASEWRGASTEFERSSNRLTQIVADLQARPWRSDWVLVALLLIAAFAAGYALGLHRAHGAAPTALARACGRLTRYSPPTHRTRRDGHGHLRSVSSPVARGRMAMRLSRPPLRPTTPTDSPGATATSNGTMAERRVPRALDCMARSRRQGRALRSVCLRAAPPP